MKYRSIDTDWEEDEIIYVGEPGLNFAEHQITLNGRKCIGIFYYDDKHYPSIAKYLSSIFFTGEARVNFHYGSYVYQYLNGGLDCLTGPAIEYQGSNSSYFCWYKRNKPWHCLLNGDGTRFPSHMITRNEAAYFDGKLWDNPDDF